jgi:spore maturation protein CgeB
MRVVIPGPRYEDSFIDNVAVTLERMGHEVLTASFRRHRIQYSRPLSLGRRIRTYLAPEALTEVERWTLKACRGWNPDVLLCLTQSVGEQCLRDCKQSGVRHRVAWWGDSPGNLSGMSLLTTEWDLVYLKDPDAVVKFRRLGVNAHLLHEAMNPLWHRPLTGRQGDQVVIAGNFYGYRQALTAKLIRDGVSVELYGGRLPRWVLPEIKKRHSGRYVAREEKSRVFGAGLACLNSSHLSEGNSLNCRAFEIAGAGGLHVMENKPIVQSCFEPGKEVLLYDSYEELREHIARAKSDEAGSEAIRRGGARRAIAEHTYQQRLRRVLSDLGAG